MVWEAKKKKKMVTVLRNLIRRSGVCEEGPSMDLEVFSDQSPNSDLVTQGSPRSFLPFKENFKSFPCSQGKSSWGSNSYFQREGFSICLSPSIAVLYIETCKGYSKELLKAL